MLLHSAPSFIPKNAIQSTYRGELVAKKARRRPPFRFVSTSSPRRNSRLLSLLRVERTFHEDHCGIVCVVKWQSMIHIQGSNMNNYDTLASRSDETRSVNEFEGEGMYTEHGFISSFQYHVL